MQARTIQYLMAAMIILYELNIFNYTINIITKKKMNLSPILFLKITLTALLILSLYFYNSPNVHELKSYNKLYNFNHYHLESSFFETKFYSKEQYDKIQSEILQVGKAITFFETNYKLYTNNIAMFNIFYNI